VKLDLMAADTEASDKELAPVMRKAGEFAVVHRAETG
jgi:hypothetical protein